VRSSNAAVPAKAGTQGKRRSAASLGSRFRAGLCGEKGPVEKKIYGEAVRSVRRSRPLAWIIRILLGIEQQVLAQISEAAAILAVLLSACQIDKPVDAFHRRVEARGNRHMFGDPERSLPQREGGIDGMNDGIPAHGGEIANAFTTPPTASVIALLSDAEAFTSVPRTGTSAYWAAA
jgi:hypothetical protein